MFYFKFKRFYDTILAFLGLVILSPLFLIIMIAIKLDSKGPILFRQKRIGRNKICFYILKFRTMRIDTPKDVPTHQLSDPNKWITRIGKILRKTSLDELPQMINILKGDMSIIGPRPALWNQDDLVAERDKCDVHRLYPGLTGYAQIHGRDELLIEEKAKLDAYYVQHMSLWMDMCIFFLTIIKVITREGYIEGK